MTDFAPVLYIESLMIPIICQGVWLRNFAYSYKKSIKSIKSVNI